MKSPLVSFIVPVYNAEKTIERCVQSLQKQTVGDIEILLIDDGSRDASLAVCNLVAKDDSRIRVIHQDNAGVSVARNVGIENAQGQYISFVDADDWIDVNVCEVFENALQKYDYDLFCFSLILHKNGTSELAKLFKDDVPLLNDAQKTELLLKTMTPWTPNFEYNCKIRVAGMSCVKLYKKEILIRNKSFFPVGIKVSEDTLFLILNLEMFKVVGYSTKIMYHYIFDCQSAQNHYRPDSFQQFSVIIERIKEWLKKENKSQLFFDSANTLFVHYLFGILKEDLFHCDNHNSLLTKQKRLKEILKEKLFVDVLNNVKWSYFKFPEKVLVLFLKLRMVRTISIAMKFVR